jgi:hypothetical protein
VSRRFRNDGDVMVHIPQLGVGVAPGETVDLNVKGPLAHLTEVGADKSAADAAPKSTKKDAA